MAKSPTTVLLDKYSEMYERQANIPKCPTGTIRSPLDWQCYPVDSEMGRLILGMLRQLERQQARSEKHATTLARVGIPTRIATSNISIKDFLSRYVATLETVEIFLDGATCESPGIAYEFLWTLCIYLRVCDDLFPGDLYQPVSGNSNQPSTFKPLDVSQWLASARINTGCTSGYSDITLKRTAAQPEREVCEPQYERVAPAYILMQSKLFDDDERRSVAGDYDMARLESLKAFDNKELMLHYNHASDDASARQSPRIVLLVRDKRVVAEKIARIKRSSRHLFLHFDVDADMLDASDLDKYYRRLRVLLSRFSTSDGVYDFERLVESTRSPMRLVTPRLHQLITLFKTVSVLETTHARGSNTFLYGAVARSGKTFMMGELIYYFQTMGRTRPHVGHRCYEPVSALDGYDTKRPFSFIIFSPVPNETIAEYRSLFTQYQEFAAYQGSKGEVVVMQGGASYAQFIAQYNPEKQYIIIISKQTLDSGAKSTAVDTPSDAYDASCAAAEATTCDDDVDRLMERLDHLLATIKSRGGDITGIFFDEHHVSGCSAKSKKMLTKFRQPSHFPRLFYVFITATYNKSMFAYHIPTNHIFTWNYEDVILCKELSHPANYERLSGYHGPSFQRAVECMRVAGYHLTDIEDEYKKFPEIHVLTHKWNTAAVTRQIGQGGNLVHFGELMRVDSDTGQFVDGNAVEGLLRLIFGDTLEYTPFSDENRRCFFNRIRRISDRIGSRTLPEDRFTSQIWFLPFGTAGSGIELVANALERKLRANRMVQRHYAVFNMKDEGVVRGDQARSYRAQIRAAEIQAEHDGYRGLIILTGKQLSLGISLPCVDVVLMLNDVVNLDVYYQMIFRALTESAGKKAGFICDFNPDRTISAIYGQSMRQTGNDPNADAKQKCLVENIIYLDNDLVEERTTSMGELMAFFDRLNLTALDGRTGLTDKTMSDITRELKHLLDGLETDEIQAGFRRLGFDKVIVHDGQLETARIETKMHRDQQTLRDLQAEIEQLSAGPHEAQTHAVQKAILSKTKKAAKLAAQIDATAGSLDEREANIKVGHWLVLMIKLGIFMTLGIGDRSATKSLRSIFTFLHEEDVAMRNSGRLVATDHQTTATDRPNSTAAAKPAIPKRGTKKGPKASQTVTQTSQTVSTAVHNGQKTSRLDSIREYLRLQGILGPEKDRALEQARIDYLVELFNPSSPHTVLRHIETVDAANVRIENMQRDIHRTVAHNETSIDRIETVLTKRCVQRPDGTRVVVKGPEMVGDTPRVSCDEIPSILHKKRLLQFIEENLTPNNTTEVWWGLLDDMMHTVPIDFWTNPTHKILEPCSGFGPFSIWCFYRLMVGLRVAMPNEEERRRHIVEQMLYMSELNGVNVEICRTIFASGGLYRPNIAQGDFLQLDPMREWGVDGFDLVCGNPPYNAPKGKSGFRVAIYDAFTYRSVTLSNRFVLLVIPSRWFRKDAQGLNRGLDTFRAFMVGRTDLSVMRHFENAQDAFGSVVSLMGGLCYFLIDASYNGPTNFNGRWMRLSDQDIITDKTNHLGILAKTTSTVKLEGLYIPRGHFGPSTNFFSTYQLDASLPSIDCFVSKTKGFIERINTKHVLKPFNFWKVITPSANGSSPTFGRIFIGGPGQIFSDTFIGFRVDTEAEAKSLLRFLQSNLANYLLSLKKNTQHISVSALEFIPLPPLDREWTDMEIYRHFGLSRDDVVEIEGTLGKHANKTQYTG